MSGTRIFLSYRRGDSRHQTARMRNELKNLGFTHLFMDTSDTQPSERWDETVLKHLEDAQVVLAVIGPQWLASHDGSGRRRIDNEADWVHRELRDSLENHRRVLPVLVDGARMPKPEDLPAGLKELAFHSAVTLRNDNFDDDVHRVATGIDGGRLAVTLILASASPGGRPCSNPSVGATAGTSSWITGPRLRERRRRVVVTGEGQLPVTST
jgi:TIR domain